MARRERKQDVRLRRAVAALRKQGGPAPEIGRRLGVPKQTVYQVFYDLAGVWPNRCRECEAVLTDRPLALSYTAPTYCLACLAKHPKAPFRHRLRAYRVAAGLKVTELAERSGVAHGTLRAYEAGVRDPEWRTLGKLVAVLGVGLIFVGKDTRIEW